MVGKYLSEVVLQLVWNTGAEGRLLAAEVHVLLLSS